ncbi:MAG: GntR family transcriptional regulator [Longimicrobiaceae bacterium]
MQPVFPFLARDNLSDALSIELRNMIVDGRLAEGERINEVHLAQSLGVSRTPLREALARLAHEGALQSVPRIGYFVRPLTLEEFGQIYPIRPLLDPEALRLAGLPSPGRMQRLRDLNAQIVAAQGADAVIGLDDAWHLELVEGCPNRVLIELIEQFIRRTRRYELALMRERENVLAAGDAHETIMAALERRDLEAACAALKSNLQTGFEPIAAWLLTREPRGKPSR